MAKYVLMSVTKATRALGRARTDVTMGTGHRVDFTAKVTLNYISMTIGLTYFHIPTFRYWLKTSKVYDVYEGYAEDERLLVKNEYKFI